jgi:hypothetical protein
MSILALKQEITRLSKQGRQEIFAYLVRLKHDTPEWKRATARRLREMRKGKGVSSDELEARLSRR